MSWEEEENVMRRVKLIFRCRMLYCVKSVPKRIFFWSVFSLVRTEYGKIRSRKNSVFGHFFTVVVDKSNLQNTEVSTEIISSSTQQHHIVKKSLTLRRIHLHHYVSVRATSSPISGYR